MRTVRTIGTRGAHAGVRDRPRVRQTKAPAKAVAAAAKDTIRVSGLNQPVEVIRDRWGINHIYAKTEHDLFFAQGYSTAKDRLFQFEIWRRQATGTVAEILGRAELKRDIGHPSPHVPWRHEGRAELVSPQGRSHHHGVRRRRERLHRRGAAQPRRAADGIQAARHQAGQVDAGLGRHAVQRPARQLAVGSEHGAGPCASWASTR